MQAKQGTTEVKDDILGHVLKVSIDGRGLAHGYEMTLKLYRNY